MTSTGIYCPNFLVTLCGRLRNPQPQWDGPTTTPQTYLKRGRSRVFTSETENVGEWTREGGHSPPCVVQTRSLQTKVT